MVVDVLLHALSYLFSGILYSIAVWTVVPVLRLIYQSKIYEATSLTADAESMLQLSKDALLAEERRAGRKLLAALEAERQTLIQFSEYVTLKSQGYATFHAVNYRAAAASVHDRISRLVAIAQDPPAGARTNAPGGSGSGYVWPPSVLGSTGNVLGLHLKRASSRQSLGESHSLRSPGSRRLSTLGMSALRRMSSMMPIPIVESPKSMSPDDDIGASASPTRPQPDNGSLSGSP